MNNNTSSTNDSVYGAVNMAQKLRQFTHFTDKWSTTPDSHVPSQSEWAAV